jgi:hypothetical protein
MSEIAGKPLLPGEVVQLLNDEELTKLAQDHDAELPNKWNRFPLKAKKVAVKNLLSGDYTKLGFKILEPDFLETLKEIGDETRKGLAKIEAMRDAKPNPEQFH